MTVKSGTVLGCDNLVLEGTVLGGMPQHVHMPEHPGTTEIGDGNVFRENCTVHRALEAGHVTTIGNRCLFMVGAHVAHDCTVADGVIMTNGAMLGGHVMSGRRRMFRARWRSTSSAALAGWRWSAVCRAWFATCRRSSRSMAARRWSWASTRLASAARILRHASSGQLKAAYRVIYRSGLTWQEMLDTLRTEFTSGPAAEFLPFFLGGKRGFVQERRTPPGAIVRLVRDDAETTSMNAGVRKESRLV